MIKIYSPTTIFLTGQAKPSKDDAISTVYQVFSLCMIIDTKTDKILDVSCTATLDMTREFIGEILKGKNLVNDVQKIEKEIKIRFFGLMQKTLLAALKDANNRYLMIYPEKKQAKPFYE